MKDNKIKELDKKIDKILDWELGGRMVDDYIELIKERMFREFPFDFDEDGFLLVQIGTSGKDKTYQTANLQDIKDYILYLIK